MYSNSKQTACCQLNPIRCQGAKKRCYLFIFKILNWQLMIIKCLIGIYIVGLPPSRPQRPDCHRPIFLAVSLADALPDVF